MTYLRHWRFLWFVQSGIVRQVAEIQSQWLQEGLWDAGAIVGGVLEAPDGLRHVFLRLLKHFQLFPSLERKI